MLASIELAQQKHDQHFVAAINHSLHECLSAYHVDRPESMKRVLEGYLDDSTSDDFDARSVVDRFEAIRGRVRYHA